MIEAELKAHLRDPEGVRAALGERAPAERATYRDTYFDDADGSLQDVGRELRLRGIETAEGRQHLLTFKEPAVDEESGSKPEHETTVGTPSAVSHLVIALGFGPVVELTKECENFRFTDAGREFLATVVRVPEIDGTFLEVETMTEEDQDAVTIGGPAVTIRETEFKAGRPYLNTQPLAPQYGGGGPVPTRAGSRYRRLLHDRGGAPSPGRGGGAMRHRQIIEHEPRRPWWAPWRRTCSCGEPMFPCFVARLLIIEGHQRQSLARQKSGGSAWWMASLGRARRPADG